MDGQRQALSKRNHNKNHSTPPPDGRGKEKKNLHSPWSAPRNRKRPNTLQPVPLTIIQEDYVSPPKRRNGGEQSPVARELQLPVGPRLSFDDAGLEGAGPLAQGLLTGAVSEDGFSPLASGLRASFSFSAGVSTSATFGVGPLPQQGSAGAPQQAQAQQRKRQGAGAAAAAAAAPARSAGNAAAGAGAPPFAPTIALGEGAPLELAECSYGVPRPGPLGHAWSAPPGMGSGGLSLAALLAQEAQQHPRPMSQLTDCSRRSHADSDLDMRSSWGSERSGDVLPWREMQARLQEEHAQREAGQRKRRGAGGSVSGSGAGAALRGSADTPVRGGASGGRAEGFYSGGEAMRLSADSLRDSLEDPACSERQASIIPLRTSIRGHWQQSHLPASPATDARHRRLPNTQSPAIQRPLGGSGGGSSGQKHKGGGGGSCFLCASPFCKPSAQRQHSEVLDEEPEAVRRADSEEFVLHRTHSFTKSRDQPPSARLRRESLNRPPSPGAELVPRQDAFSAKCCATPVQLLSPASACSEEDGPAFGHSPEVPQVPSSQELLACLQDRAKNPTIDELNDMLRTFCTLDLNPKDAEELVDEACRSCQLAPNAVTLRTLDKIWAAHDQMYG